MARCECISDIWVTYGSKRSDGPEHRPLEGAARESECGTSGHAPMAMPPPTEAKEGCSGLVGEACARQLNGGVDG